MATTKVSELTELTSADNADLLLIADTSVNQSKKIQKSNITEQNFTTTLKNKLDAIEASADVTDTANVTAAGALMDSEVTNLAQVKAFSSADYATAAQGTLADSALQSSDIGTSVQAYSSVLAGTTASFTTADETKLDGVETGATADQTAQEIATAIDADATAETTLKSALGLGTAAYTASTDYATAAQGTTADSALQNVSEDTTPQLGGDLSSNGNDINFSDSDKAQFGASNDLQIYHDGSNSFIHDSGTGNLYVRASNALYLNNADNTQVYADFANGGGANLYHNNSAKLSTTSTGIDVTGTVTTDTARSADVVDNDGSFDLNAGTNFTCTPTGNITLTFTNIPDGQSGTIVLVNTGGHTISAAASTKVMGADMLTTITTAGTYVIGYISDGTNVRVYNSAAQQ